MWKIRENGYEGRETITGKNGVCKVSVAGKVSKSLLQVRDTEKLGDLQALTGSFRKATSLLCVIATPGVGLRNAKKLGFPPS